MKPLHGEKGSLISLWNTHWRSSEIARNGNKNSRLVQEPKQPRTRRWPLLSEDENRKWITVMLKIPNTTQLAWWLPAAPNPEPQSPSAPSFQPQWLCQPGWLLRPCTQPRAKQSLPRGHCSQALAVLQSLTSGGERESPWEERTPGRLSPLQGPAKLWVCPALEENCPCHFWRQRTGRMPKIASFLLFHTGCDCANKNERRSLSWHTHLVCSVPNQACTWWFHCKSSAHLSESTALGCAYRAIYGTGNGSSRYLLLLLRTSCLQNILATHTSIKARYFRFYTQHKTTIATVFNAHQ